jgi:hypothetical protein
LYKAPGGVDVTRADVLHCHPPQATEVADDLALDFLATAQAVVNHHGFSADVNWQASQPRSVGEVDLLRRRQELARTEPLVEQADAGEDRPSHRVVGAGARAPGEVEGRLQ